MSDAGTGNHPAAADRTPAPDDPAVHERRQAAALSQSRPVEPSSPPTGAVRRARTRPTPLPSGQSLLVGFGGQHARVGVLDEGRHLAEADVRGERQIRRCRSGWSMSRDHPCAATASRTNSVSPSGTPGWSRAATPPGVTARPSGSAGPTPASHPRSPLSCSWQRTGSRTRSPLGYDAECPLACPDPEPQPWFIRENPNGVYGQQLSFDYFLLVQHFLEFCRIRRPVVQRTAAVRRANCLTSASGGSTTAPDQQRCDDPSDAPSPRAAVTNVSGRWPPPPCVKALHFR